MGVNSDLLLSLEAVIVLIADVAKSMLEKFNYTVWKKY